MKRMARYSAAAGAVLLAISVAGGRRVTVAALVGLLAVIAPTAEAEAGAGTAAGPQRSAWQGSERSVGRPDAAPERQTGGASEFLPSTIECLAERTGFNTNLDCDDPVLPNNEPDIEVDPVNPRHMVASSNDYDSNGDQFYTSFDGGRTWTTGDMSLESPERTGSDPVTTFDPKHGTVLHSSLNFLITPEGLAADGDLVVSISTNGGRTWGQPVVVAGGFGDDDDPVEIFHDKPWMVTDTNPSSPYYGRTYLTWSRFLFHSGVYVESPIFEAHSDDGGSTWSTPKEISGRNANFCTFQEEGPAGECDEDQFSVPTVGPDGTVSMAFVNEQHEAAWEPGEQIEDQYMVVRSSDGGRTFSRPVHVVDLEDGTRDYPTNVDGIQTLTGMQFRVWPVGNLVADPRTGRLFLVFSDNRAGRHDVDQPVTNVNVYVMASDDGTRWAGPLGVATGPRDQWFPWADVNPRTGQVGVLYHDRTGADVYDTSLATSSQRGFDSVRVSTARSHPNESLFFQADVPECPKCATFIGDYIGLDYGSDGSANVVWTDMRRRVTADGNSAFTENIFYARLP